MENLKNNFYIEANINNKYKEIYGPFHIEAAYSFLVNDFILNLKTKYKKSFLLSSILYSLENDSKVVYLKRNLSRINNETT